MVYNVKEKVGQSIKFATVYIYKLYIYEILIHAKYV